ncbi:MAG: PD-(D/E)XK nuclease family protein [Bacteroidales bacterium]|jgi:hypothetical protein|nr:PD-(D/E)XK nuclease family protein [Bacteroidales bacterium]
MRQSNKESFLSRVAVALLSKSETLKDMVVLLPSRRAIQYLQQEIVIHNDKPVFSPCCITIDDWIKANVQWQTADELSLVYNLYLSYCDVFYAHNKDIEREPFEQFYFWGKIILADFDDLDKHLADSSLLFTNLDQYREIDAQFNPLTDEQKQLLEQFFTSFKAQKETSIKTNFVNIWNCLDEIYTNFHNRLRQQGLAYSGMIYREFYRRLQDGEINLTDSKFAVVGFNVLSLSEQKIFEYLQTNTDAAFYWDYDNYYTDDKLQEAGTFISNNIKTFPNEDFAHQNFNRIKDNQQNIEIIASNGETLQTSCISKWAKNLENVYKDSLKQEDMVIILANESLLPVVVRALPQEIAGKPTKANITMGYPFSQTEIYAFVENFLTCQTKNTSPVAALENLSLQICERYGKLPISETNNLLIEAAYQIDKKIEEFTQSLKNTDPNAISLTFVQKTLMSELRSLSLPFQSDNTDGLQIMGMLESRNLDFRYVLMLSTSDDFLPNVGSYSTFIPYSIRKAFGLMSVEKRIAVFAYYFYRLFHCAESLTFVYNTQNDGTKAKEKSRFLQQAELEMGKSFNHISLMAQTNLQTSPPKDYPKKPNHIEIILNKTYLSAAFLNTFLDCGLKLYFKYIIGLKSITYGEEDISALAFGNLFHQSATILYGIKESITPSVLSEVVNQALGSMESLEERSIITQIHRDIVIKYLRILINYNQSTGRQPLLTEEEVMKDLLIEVNGEKRELKLGGRIDRIDFDGGNLVVVDYKTGGEVQQFKDMDILFRNPTDKRATYVFQILFYCWLLWDNEAWKQKHNITFSTIKPQIIYIHKLKAKGDKDFSPSKYGETIIYDSDFHEEFDQWLKDCLTSLLSLDNEKFYWRNKTDKNCLFCEYSIICN